MNIPSSVDNFCLIFYKWGPVQMSKKSKTKHTCNSTKVILKVLQFDLHVKKKYLIYFITRDSFIIALVIGNIIYKQ